MKKLILKFLSFWKNVNKELTIINNMGLGSKS